MSAVGSSDCSQPANEPARQRPATSEARGFMRWDMDSPRQGMSGPWAVGVIISLPGSLFFGPRQTKTLDIPGTMKPLTRSRSFALLAGFLVVGGCAGSEPGTTPPGSGGNKVTGTAGNAATGT